MEKLIRKDNALLVVYCPDYLEMEQIRGFERNISNYCDKDVFPLILKTTSNDFKIEMLNCQNLTDTKLETLKDSINKYIKNFKK